MTLAGYEPTPAEEMPQDNAQDQAIEGHYREITPEAAAKLITSAGERYGHLTTERLKKIRDRLGRELAADTLPSEYARNDAAYRLQAAEVLLERA